MSGSSGPVVALHTPSSSFCITRRPIAPPVTRTSFALGARRRNVTRRSAETSGERTGGAAGPRPCPHAIETAITMTAMIFMQFSLYMLLRLRAAVEQPRRRDHRESSGHKLELKQPHVVYFRRRHHRAHDRQHRDSPTGCRAD